MHVHIMHGSVPLKLTMISNNGSHELNRFMCDCCSWESITWLNRALFLFRFDDYVDKLFYSCAIDHLHHIMQGDLFLYSQKR